MRMTSQLPDLGIEPKPIVLAVGYFDGVHKGHQAVVRRAVEEARKIGGEAWPLTFDPHPLKILEPEAAPPLITSTPHKLELIEPLGADGCVVMPFTGALAAQEPDVFVASLKKMVPSLAKIVVGKNWTFGHLGRGNAALLRKLAPASGISVAVVEPLLWKGEPISSTRIRQAVSKGDLDDAREMMGRPFSILGTVVPGRHIGTQLGFPTANLNPHNEVRPPPGVYAVRARVGTRLRDGAAFVAKTGEAATTPSGPVLEVHLMDFDAELYGRDIEVFFLRWMRDAIHFPTRGQLRVQIAADVERARKILGEIT